MTADEVALTAAPRRVGVQTVAGLFGGRVAFRVVQLGLNVAFAHRWAHGGYADYAAAMGSSVFLISLTAVGLEKAALKIVPRATGGPGVLKPLLAYCALFSALGLVIIAIRAGTSSTPGLIALAGAYGILLGENQVLVGLHRALGHPLRDTATYLFLAAWTAAAGVLTLVGHHDASWWLVGLCAGIAVANLVLATTVWSAVRSAPAVSSPVTTVVWMAVGDVVGGLCLSGVFVALSLSGHSGDSSSLYLTITASSLVLSAVAYAYRIFQPQVSAALDAGRRERMDAMVVPWLRRLAWWGVPYLIAVVAAAWALDRAAPFGHHGYGPFVLFVLASPLIVAMDTINYAYENGTASELRRAAVTAIGALVAALAAAALLVPWLGGVGAISILAAIEVFHALLLNGSRRRVRTGASVAHA